jgi:glycosyltransferase involved in cell wall biosynthesis
LVTERFLPDAFGGGEISSHLLARTLATKHKVTVITTGDGSTETMDGFTVKRVIPRPSKRLPEDLRRGEALTLATLKGLLGAVKRSDIIHVYGIRTSVGTVISSRLKDIPAVATVNDPWATCYYSLHFKDGNVCERCSSERFKECLKSRGGDTAALPYLKVSMKERLFFLSKFDGLMPLSKAMEEILRGHGVECDMMVVPPMIDTAHYSYKKPGDGDVLGFVGRIDEGKGLDDAIRISASTGLRLRVIGEGPAMRDMKKLADSLGAGDLVDFVGKVPIERVPAEYHKMSLVLAPFKRVEAMGRVVLEANACGRGVITTTISGASMAVRQGFNGYVFEPGDLSGMEKAVEEVTRDRALLEELGRNGRKYVEENNSPKVILKRTEAFYKRVIASRKG